MDLLTFLRLVLPEDGIYCSATRREDGGWINTPHTSIEQLANACLAVSAQNRDVWYATAAFAREREFDPRFKSYRFRRTQDNVKALKALRLDVDVHPTKEDAYPDTRAALQALNAFLDQTNLPMPLVVRSGYGLHIYWPLETSVAPDVWLHMSELLRATCAGLGFRVDNSGTTDSARVLRPPQTNNFKRGSVRPVRVIVDGAVSEQDYLLECLQTASEPFAHLIRHHKPKGKDAPKPTQQLPDMLKSMLIVPDTVIEDRKRVVGPIVRECQQIREAGTQAEPTWHRMISLVKMCHRGDEAIHALSKAAPDQYDFDTVEEKIHASEALPITCAEFDTQRPDVCRNCKHWQRITSPIQLGVKTIPIITDQNTQPTPTSVPEEFSEQSPQEQLFNDPGQAVDVVKTFAETEWRDANYEITDNGCWQITYDDTGTRKTQITPYVIKPVSLFRAGNGDKTIRWELHFDKGEPPELVELPMASIHDPNAILSAFSAKGMTLGKIKSNKHFCDFVKDYFYSIHHAGAMMRINRYNHLGWGEDNEFVLGDKIILPDGSIIDEPELPFGQWNKVITQAGSLSEWIGAVRHMFTPPEMAKPALMFLHGFSSPLMRYFYGTEATLTFVVGPTGVGKSTLASLMWSIWAQPFSFAKGAGDLNSSAGTTMNSLFREASILHCLPFYIDEATLWAEQNVPSYVYDISSGQEKKRLGPDLQQKEAGSWRTNAMATSNTSLRMKLTSVLEQPEPALARVIEFSLPKVEYGNRYVNDINTMHANYGHAGVHYARFLTANAESGKLKEVIDTNRAMLVKRYRLDNDERYWTAWATCIYTGMELARAAGLHTIDADVILELMGEIIDDQRLALGNAKGNRSSWFGEMMSDLWPNTLVVANSSITDKDGRKLLTTVRMPHQAVAVRTNATTGVTYVSIKAARRWCSVRSIRFDDFVEEIHRQIVKDGELTEAKEVRYALGAGVSELQSASAPIRCLRFKVNPDTFSELLEMEE